MKDLKLKRLAGGLGALTLFAGYSLNAFAAPQCPETLDPSADYKCVFIDVGTSHGGDADSKTTPFYEMGYSGTLATSIYTPFNPSSPSGMIIDSNIKQVINYYGLSGGPANYLPISGNPPMVSLKDTPTDPQERNIDTLTSSISPFDTERMDPTDAFSGQGWALTYNYFLKGTLNASGPSFSEGYIDYFFIDWADPSQNQQVLRVNITSSSITLANLELRGYVTFDWTGGGNDLYGLPSIGDGTNDCTTTLCQNFWNFQTTTPSGFYALEGMGVEISMKLDTNVNPPIPTSQQLVQFTGADGNQYWIRQTTLDGSVRFNVPEPGSLALLGLGLAGLGLVARRRATKA